MPRILGIDTSLTATGLARIDIAENDDGPLPKYSITDIATATVRAPNPGSDKRKTATVRRVDKLMEQIEDAITCPDDPLVPTLIGIESLAYGAKGNAVWVLPLIWGRTLGLANKYGVPVIEVGTGQIKKYAAGNGNADKSTVMLAVNKRWPAADVRNDNESDAMTAAAIACHFLDYPIVGEVFKYHQEVMAKVHETQSI